MLRSNLATRPFYNERLVHIVLGLGLAAILALTAFNVTRIIGLSSRQAALAADAGRDETRAADLTARATSIRQSIDPKALERVTDAAIQANTLIDARAFSWTALLNDIETTLPPTVMLTTVTPRVSKDEEGVSVHFVVIGRTVEAIDTFIERLEQTSRFREVLAVAEEVTDDGLFQTTIEGKYQQPAAASAPEAKPAAAATAPVPAAVPAATPAPTSAGGPR
jgi:Tfp pilus assembly protein PilN